MMNYITLERIVRNAACKPLGAKSENFDRWLVTSDPNEGIEIEGFDLGTSVELAFDPSISPFSYFSSDVVFFVNLSTEVLGDVQIFFGRSCSDTTAAEAAAKEFLKRDETEGWYAPEYFDENCGLHLIREFSYDPDDELDIENKISACFNELLENEIADGLRSFIHYFED